MITITRVLDDIINHQQIPLDRILSRYLVPVIGSALITSGKD